MQIGLKIFSNFGHKKQMTSLKKKKTQYENDLPNVSSMFDFVLPRNADTSSSSRVLSARHCFDFGLNFLTPTPSLIFTHCLTVTEAFATGTTLLVDVARVLSCTADKNKGPCGGCQSTSMLAPTENTCVLCQNSESNKYVEMTCQSSTPQKRSHRGTPLNSDRLSH